MKIALLYTDKAGCCSLSKKYCLLEMSPRWLEGVLNEEAICTVADPEGLLGFEDALTLLQAGKSVATSNILMAADHYAVLNNAAAERGSAFSCSAALAGGREWMDALMGADSFAGILTDGGDAQREAAACLFCAGRSFGVALQKKEVYCFPMDSLSRSDRDTAEEHGLVPRLISRGHRTQQGITAYTEPCFLSPEHPLAAGKPGLEICAGQEKRLLEAKDGMTERLLEDCEALMPAAYAEEIENENTIDIKPYYIRFSGDSGGWLDIVTRERWGNGVKTMPVSAKAIHSWARHAKRLDGQVFIAGIIE